MPGTNPTVTNATVTNVTVTNATVANPTVTNATVITGTVASAGVQQLISGRCGISNYTVQQHDRCTGVPCAGRNKRTL